MILLDSDTDTREAVRRPGRFENAHPMTPFLWDRVVLEGCEDEEWSDGMGEYVARVGRWLVSRSSVGFIDAYKYPTVEEARTAIAALWAETDLDAAW